MAAVYGIQLVNKLNTATVRRTYLPNRYDILIDRLTNHTQHNVLHRALDFNATTREATVVQLYPPLNAWTPSSATNVTDYTYLEWVDFIQERSTTFSEVLRQRYPITTYANRFVNPLVVGAAFSDFLNADDISVYLEHLFYDPRVESPVQAILSFPYQWTPRFHVFQEFIRTGAGCKYARSSRDMTPPTPARLPRYGKHRPAYATVFYYNTLAARSTILAGISAGPTALEHFDSPTYGPHIILPQAGDVLGYHSRPVSQADLLMTESVMDCLRENSQASASTAVARLDQTYHPVANFDPTNEDSMMSRLTNLALLVVQGAQAELAIPTVPTNDDVRGFVARLMSEGQRQRWFPYRTDRVLIHPDSPFVLPPGDFYAAYRVANFPFTSGTYTSVPNATKPLRVLPQYRAATILPAQATQAYEDHVIAPININHGYCISGGVYFTADDISIDPTPFPARDLAQLPQNYFDPNRMARRELLRRLRVPSDRSYLKDNAVFTFLASLVNPATALPALQPGFSLAYLGASAAHAKSDEPTILADLRNGSIPGLPIPSRIAQFGYDVVHGSLLDLTRAVPTGTFGLVYADLDQVEDAGTDLPAANRAALAMLGTTLQMCTAGGVAVLKVNFPTVEFWTQLFNQYATFATTLHVVKPIVVNSSEVFVVMSGRQSAGNLTCTTSLQRALLAMYARNAAIDQTMTHVPMLGQADDGTSALGMEAIRLFDPLFVEGNPNAATSALATLMANVVPSSIHMSRLPVNGPVSTTIFGKRTFLSTRRRDRLLEYPLPMVTAINHQRRFTAPPSFSIYPTEPVNVTTLVAAGYNAYVHTVITSAQPAHLFDLGTGPECRILSLVPQNTRVTMVDSRPCAELMQAYDPNTTAYEQADYTLAAFWNGRQCDAVSAIFTLGAAAASNAVTIDALLANLLPSIANAGTTRLWLQVNAPLAGPTPIPGLIDIDTRAGTYTFNNGERTEPYIDPQVMQATVLAHFPNATLSWYTLPPTCEWLDYIIGAGSSLDLSTIPTALQYSQLTPILSIDTNVAPLRVNPIPTPLGQQCAIRIPTNDPAAVLDAKHRGVPVITGTPAALTSLMGNAALQYIQANNEFLLQLTPTLAGIFDVTLTSAGQPPIPRGSFTITAPPPTAAVTMPANIDYTDAGNDGPIACDPYYNLAVCIMRNGQYVRVNPEKARVETVAAGRALHFVLDLADNHVLMYLCDVTPAAIGAIIAHPLADIYQLVFPNNTPLRASLPYIGGGARVELNNQPYLSLTNPPPVLPAGTALAALATAASVGQPTYTLPAGAYRYVLE
ncbi:VP1 [American grass carp reovirus]|uniref:Outer capsid protein VP1 n=1 Tax=Aquareovirus G (isolate American grass carp/USA/PB01-155/-) TaxID=648234 RepID=VP1_AQRVG|nr:VP1 [American grass carp reovirus]B2BND9.1 RecName: Full=Outer capsid protein VP1; Includes: RecName: Full=mRNA guanylyltransferase; Includes: RecName: Full=mRNA (guanine-N(7))-methyltransferase [American grass carp reovirus PB01-155]ABV01039.1 VP1 [American grass carp reovirus]